MGRGFFDFEDDVASVVMRQGRVQGEESSPCHRPRISLTLSMTWRASCARRQGVALAS